MNSLIISSKNSFVQNVDLRGMSECRNCLRLQNRRAQERKKRRSTNPAFQNVNDLSNTS